MTKQEPTAGATPAPAARYAGSLAYMTRARSVIPRGVGSAKRAALRPTPLAFASARGGHVVDVDGNEYVDYVAGYGPILLGHGFEPIDSAVAEQLTRGTLYGGQHPAEAELAELLVNAVPSAERVLFNVTGSEADHAALRLARAATGRRLIVKFAGHYHGWIDPLTGGAGEPAGPPGAAVYPEYAFGSGDVLICPWNDITALAALLDQVGQDVAAVILEPVAVNAGCLAPDDGYLEGVRELCSRHGALLVFDEVVTGFRVALGGAQERFGVRPDLTVLGKAIAAGHQLSAVVGRADVLRVAEGAVAWAGTFNGQALAVAAATATVRHLTQHRQAIYGRLERTSAALVAGVNEAGRAAGLPLTAQRVGSIVRLYWDVPPPANTYANVLRGDGRALGELSAHLVDLGIHCREGGLWYVSAAHSTDDVERTVSAVETALTRMQALGDARTRPAVSAEVD